MFSYAHVLHKTSHWEVSRRSRAVDVKEILPKSVIHVQSSRFAHKTNCCLTLLLLQNNAGALSIQPKRSKIGNSGKWYRNVREKFPEIPKDVEFPKCEPCIQSKILEIPGSKVQGKKNFRKKFFKKFGHPSRNKTYGCKEEQWGKGTSRVLTTEVFNSI